MTNEKRDKADKRNDFSPGGQLLFENIIPTQEQSKQWLSGRNTKNIFTASLGQHYVAAWSDPLDRPAARPAYHDDLGQTDQ